MALKRPSLPHGLLEAMREAAIAAGDNAIKVRAEGRNDAKQKDDKSVVTIADPEGETLIRERLQEYLAQGFSFVGEETGTTEGTTGFQFVIDPIDGTTNFSNNDPDWAVSVGLTYNGVPVAGVVYQPHLDKLYFAEEGHGAFLTEGGKTRQLRVPTEKPNAYVLETLFPRHPDFDKQQAFNSQYYDYIDEKMNSIGRFRSSGCPSVPLCMLAEGGRTGVVAKPVRMWDVAASLVIAQEAGAQVYIAPDKPNDTSPTAEYSLVAATQEIFSDLKKIFDSTVGRAAHTYRTTGDENLTAQLAHDGIKYGVSIGRRAPMHRVHIDCIKEMVASGLHPIIVIGSANTPDSPFHNPLDNPLDEVQQREQITRALAKEGIKDYTILALRDRGNTSLWAAALAALLRDNGFKPSACVSHYRSKAADAFQATHVIQPLNATEAILAHHGISSWSSTNRDPEMDSVSATPFRAMHLADPANQGRLDTDLVAPEYIIKQALKARSEDPDKDLLKDVPVTMADLVLRRFRNERHLSTAQIMQDQPAASLESLRVKLAEVSAPPGASITGNLTAKSSNQEQQRG